MANLYIDVDGVKLYPNLPVERGFELIYAEQRMLDGALRRAYRATKITLRFYRDGLTDADRATWINALPRNASMVVTDDRGTARTMLLRSLSEQLEETSPSSPGALADTGRPGRYRIDVELEEV